MIMIMIMIIMIMIMMIMIKHVIRRAESSSGVRPASLRARPWRLSGLATLESSWHVVLLRASVTGLTSSSSTAARR